MSDEKAKYILHEIKSIRRYKSILKEIDEDLRIINEKINSVQEPSCPLGTNGPKIENHKDKATIVNSFLTDEMEFLKERDKFAKLKAEAEGYYARFRLKCNTHELQLSDAFFRGVSYRRMISDYGYENPYKKMIDLVKKLDS